MPFRDTSTSNLVSLASIPEADLKHSLACLTDWLDRQKAYRQRDIVKYLAAEELSGRAHLIKAYTLAVDVFGKETEFDPSRSSLVRVEMHRLRESLARFYREGGHGVSHVLVLPAGNYRLMAMLNDGRPDTAGPAALSPGEVAPERRPGRGRPPTDRARPPGQTTDRAADANAASSPTSRRKWFGWLLVALLAIAALAFWAVRGGPLREPSIPDLSPTVAIEIDRTDRHFRELSEIRQLVSTMHPIRYPVTIGLKQNTDYVLRLATFVGPGGVTKMEASLYDAARELVVTELMPDGNLDDGTSRIAMGDRLDDHFLSANGYVATNFPRNAAYDERRRQIYGCYKAVNLWVLGKSTTMPNFDEALDCLDPDALAEPRDKVLLHVIRSGIIANAVAGVNPLKRQVTMDDARAELNRADTVYPDRLVILGQRIVLEWRDPNRNSASLRRLLAVAERGVMSTELRYNVAVSYAYFLGDWDMARKVVGSEHAGQQGTRETMEGLYHYVEIPEPFVKGDYAAAKTALIRTGGKNNPTNAIFALAIACAQNNTGDIATALRGVESNPALKTRSAAEYIRSRHYAPALEQALLAALGRPECKAGTGQAALRPSLP